MKVELKDQIERVCGEVLKKVSIKEGQTILDFGCGEGNYTIPAAKIVGPKGKVYGLDEDGNKLKELEKRAKSAGLQNIETIKTSGELNFEFEDGTFNVVLLYDIFWYFSLGDPKLSELLKEIYRVLKPDGLISVYPEHIETEELKQEIKRSGFHIENRFRGKIIHEGSPEQGQILNFGKKMQDYLVKPIGVVRSNYREASLTLQDQDLKLNREILTRTKTNKGGISELIIKEEYKDCLDGIEDFSHIVVLYWAHRVNDEKRYVAKVHPAGKKEHPLVGIFATRSPARPNPICTTTVQLLERKENVLKVKSLDAIDGSPIIDIKFHHPSYDAPPNIKWPDWMKKLVNYFREELK